MMPTSRDYILSKYKVHQLKAIEDFVAETVEVSVFQTLILMCIFCQLSI